MSPKSQNPKNNIYLIDGSGFIFRAYYALPPLTRSDGLPVGAVSGSFNTAIFFLYGFYVFLLVSNDKKRNNLLSNRTQIVGNLFAAIIIPVSILSLFGLIPAAAWGALFILGGVILYPLFIIGVGDAIGNYSKD